VYPVVGTLKHHMSSPDKLQQFLESCNVVVGTMPLLSRFSEAEQMMCMACCTHLS
jgi:hypothetical protein